MGRAKEENTHGDINTRTTTGDTALCAVTCHEMVSQWASTLLASPCAVEGLRCWPVAEPTTRRRAAEVARSMTELADRLVASGSLPAWSTEVHGALAQFPTYSSSAGMTNTAFPCASNAALLMVLAALGVPSARLLAKRHIRFFGPDDRVSKQLVRAKLVPQHWVSGLSSLTLDDCICRGVFYFPRARNVPTYEWASEGHMDCLAWSVAHGKELGIDTFNAAAMGGHIACLQWLYSRKCNWGPETCAWAAHGGHLEALKWLRAHRCPWDKNTMAYAAAKGHLHVMKWAKENGCPWSADVCESAARSGQLECLQWAHFHGCPLTAMVCTLAVEKRQWACLDWALQQGCPYEGYWFV